MAEEKMIVEEIKNTGLILADPSPANYNSPLFGALGVELVGAPSPLDQPKVIFPTGYGWKQVALDYGNPELQFNRQFDTFCCVIFGIAKQLCYYIFKVYGIKYTVEEMYNAFWAGVVKNQGTTVEAGMESFRTKGWVEDGAYPEYTFTPETTMKQFFQAAPLYIEIDAKGKLVVWEFHWEVLPKNLKAIFEAYKRYPVGLTGFAWASYYGTGIYYDYNNRANHYFVGLEPAPNGKNNLIVDNYPKDFKYVENSEIGVGDLFKELDSSFKYGSAHVCWVTPRDKKKISLLKFLKNMDNFYYYWDVKSLMHKFFYVGIPHGLGIKYRQEILWEEMNKIEKAIFLALRKSMNQSDWGEVSQFPDIYSINKKFF